MVFRRRSRTRAPQDKTLIKATLSHHTLRCCLHSVCLRLSGPRAARTSGGPGGLRAPRAPGAWATRPTLRVERRAPLGSPARKPASRPPWSLPPPNQAQAPLPGGDGDSSEHQRPNPSIAARPGARDSATSAQNRRTAGRTRRTTFFPKATDAGRGRAGSASLRFMRAGGRGGGVSGARAEPSAASPVLSLLHRKCDGKTGPRRQRRHTSILRLSRTTPVSEPLQQTCASSAARRESTSWLSKVATVERVFNVRVCNAGSTSLRALITYLSPRRQGPRPKRR